MKKWLALAAIVLACVSSARGQHFVESVIEYNPGVGFATEFGTGAGYTNIAAVLGAPSRITPGPFGGPVDPFSPPYLSEQLLSIGAGGSLTIRLGSLVLNDPAHPFGIDFLVFGNAGFVITNGNFSGGGITDGSLFGANSGATRVSVSSDDVRYFVLDPARAPVLDGLFPTDGIGNLQLAVNPALSHSSFSGSDLIGIRQLYGGSAGGTGFDLDWALDENGQRFALDAIRFVRVDVLSGSAELDAFVVVPEPGSIALIITGLLLCCITAKRRSGPNARRCHETL